METRPGDEPKAGIGWGRALLSALTILVLGVALLVYLPNWIINHFTGMSRSSRVGIVTTVFFVMLLAIAWGLRRLQARRVI